MAQQGMFGSSLKQAVTDENALRLQEAQTGGLTGWAAITNAMSGIGSEIGYQGGQAMGGMTPAQSQQAGFQSIMESSPDFDPSNPESLQQMSSKMWNGGYYDQGMAMMEKSQSITADNLNVKIKQLQLKEAQKSVNTPDARGMTELKDGYKYWTDSLEAGTPERVASSIVIEDELSIPDRIAKDKADRIAAGRELVQTMPRTTSSDMLAVATVLEDAGYTDIPEYKNLRSNIISTQNTELTAGNQAQTDLEQSARVQQQKLDDTYARALDRNSATDIVSTFFLDNNPSGSTNESDKVLASGIGAEIATYDRKLYNARELGRVTPTQAEPYYEKVLLMPEVYVADRKGFGGYIWSKKNFNLVLDTAFGNNNKKVTYENASKYLANELIIPNVTMFDLPGGAQVLDEMTVKYLTDGTWSFDTIFAED